MKFTPSLVYSAALLALLSACGGGGGGGGSASSSTSTSSAVAITASNDNTVATATLASGFALEGTQSSGSSATGSPSAASTSHALGVLVRRAMSNAVSSSRAHVASATATAASATDSEACGVSGTVSTSLSGNTSSGTLSAGDVITAVFSQCQDSSDLSMNGTLALTVVSVTSAEQFTANAVLQGFDIVDVGVASVLNGAMSVTESDTATESNSTAVVGASGLTVAMSSTNYNDTVTFDSGLSIAYSQLNSNNQGSLSINGTFSSASMGGSVTVATQQPLVQLATDAYPSSGVISVAGAGNSSLLLTVINASQVQLQLDASGDGTYQSTTDASWATLVP